MVQLLNILSGDVLIYWVVTRGAVAVARGLTFVVRRAR